MKLVEFAVVLFVAALATPAAAQQDPPLLAAINIEAAKIATEDATPATQEPGRQDRGGVEKKIYRASQDMVVAGLVADVATIVYNIGHPLRATYENCPGCGLTYVSVDFKEAGQSRIFGTNNIGAFVASNAAFDIGFMVLTRTLHKKGGFWAKIADSMNFVQGGQRIKMAADNMSKRRASQRDLVPAGATNVTRW